MSNTPLNDALTNVIVWLEGGCDPKHAAAELRLIRESANTPESSNSPASNGAAQGAMTREALLHLICDNTGKRINLPNFTIEELEDFAHAVLSFGWKPADDVVLLCVACSEPTGAQPSDATAQPSAGDWQQYAKEGESAQDVIERERKDSNALLTLLRQAKEAAQPRVDLTDERAAVIQLCRDEIEANSNRQSMLQWHVHDTPKRILAELLANTNAQHSPAQGKPDHIEYDLELAKRIVRDNFHKALAAKKG